MLWHTVETMVHVCNKTYKLEKTGKSFCVELILGDEIAPN